jgi:threonine dehydratase
MDLLKDILRAEARIRGFVRNTPLERSAGLSSTTGGNVYLKMENLQHTGSFKVRGAANRMLALEDGQRSAGVVAASTGNHGAAVAYAAQKLNIQSTVFVPSHASRTKVDAMKRLGSDVRFHGEDCVAAESSAREDARRNGKTYISPYNDSEVIAGQGTIGVEIADCLDRIDRIFVSLGGGGLISGISCYLKAVHPRIRVVACSPENSCVMMESIRAGRILELESKPTLSDGTAGGVEAGAITFDLCRSLVDEYVTVSEDEIAVAMRTFMESEHMLIEGAAGVALAGLFKSERNQNGSDVVVLCGANVSPETLKSIL